MNETAMVITAVLALLYLRRMEPLHYLRNGFSFVLQNAVGAISASYSTWDIAAHGLQPVHAFLAVMAGLYLLRSRDTYVEEITKPMELQEVDVTRFSGRRNT